MALILRIELAAQNLRVVGIRTSSKSQLAVLGHRQYLASPIAYPLRMAQDAPFGCKLTKFRRLRRQNAPQAALRAVSATKSATKQRTRCHRSHRACNLDPIER